MRKEKKEKQKILEEKKKEVEYNFLVYGTLKKGFCNSSVMSQAGGEYINSFWVDDFCMYDLGGVPIVAKGNGRIFVEHYHVPESGIPLLDNLEGYDPDNPNGGGYTRKLIPITGKQDGFLYIFNRKLKGFEHIPSGVWSEGFDKKYIQKEASTEAEEYDASMMYWHIPFPKKEEING